MRNILISMMMVPVAAMASPSADVSAYASAKKEHVAVQSTFKSMRPEEKDRLFRSDAVEKQILALKDKLTAIDPASPSRRSGSTGCLPTASPIRWTPPSTIVMPMAMTTRLSTLGISMPCG